MSSVTPDRAPPEFEAATQVLVVSDSARSRDFYSGALGADVVSEYGGSSVVLRLAAAGGRRRADSRQAHGREVRAFFRDPDGHLFEISEAKGGRR